METHIPAEGVTLTVNLPHDDAPTGSIERDNAKKTDLGRFAWRQIGVIRTPFTDPEGMPIQPCGAEGIGGIVEVYPEYAAGLKDIEGFSRIHLIYYFHRCFGWSAELVPFLDNQARGVFATRAPRRPNPIGLSSVRLVAREGDSLVVEGVDMLDGTPLIDIKPYIPAFDSYPGERCGWFPEDSDISMARSDGRFL
ncbi:MAG: tRNA (N6-threonylcarbamoyladenosine(37)-N6)-methyltransferase TrmO [Methanoregulaceae archaeon]|nr:tRNA (N6-threonylcarbamoyladenosine(37)-N6)-methyltransferase TrmO [Methanoregulaceae archaeon]